MYTVKISFDKERKNGYKVFSEILIRKHGKEKIKKILEETENDNKI